MSLESLRLRKFCLEVIKIKYVNEELLKSIGVFVIVMKHNWG